MKKTISVTVENELILAAKAYAIEKKISVSKLVENHFQKLIELDKSTKNHS